MTSIMIVILPVILLFILFSIGFIMKYNSLHSFIEDTNSSITCNYCHGTNIFMIDNQPLCIDNAYFKSNRIQFDSELYCTFKCEDCKSTEEIVLFINT